MTVRRNVSTNRRVQAEWPSVPIVRLSGHAVKIRETPLEYAGGTRPIVLRSESTTLLP